MIRFTIRDVLWLVALAAISLAWWNDHRRVSQIESDRRRWEFRAQTLREHVNGMMDGQKINPWTIEFDPENEAVLLRATKGDPRKVAGVAAATSH